MTDQTQVAGLPVAGYKATQSQAAIDQVSAFKRDEERLLRKLDDMEAENGRAILANGGKPLPVGQMPYDPRWIAIGRTHLQEAFMFINRAVFQPARVALPGDPSAADPS